MSGKDANIALILKTCDDYGIVMREQRAYVLATAEWETNRTFLPVREAYWLSEAWRKAHLRYYPYYGRGFVQITWERNYEKFGKLLGLPLKEKPDLALDPETAARIMALGFRDGLFTGKSIGTYISDKKVDFVNARRCINGVDRAHTIAGMAREWLDRGIPDQD